MSKLSFRARALDATKPLPVFRCEDLPDLHEYASINRAVPQMPTGMEKEEESVCYLVADLVFCDFAMFSHTAGAPILPAQACTKWPPFLFFLNTIECDVIFVLRRSLCSQLFYKAIFVLF